MIAPLGKREQQGGRPSPLCTVLVLAAGRSTRMGGELSKQFLPLCGVPVLARTLAAFEICETVGRVVIVASDTTIVRAASLVREYGFEKVVRIVRGGETRQQSASVGLRETDDDTAFLAVHDGARPLIAPEAIDRVVNTAVGCGAASAAARVLDTIKVTDAEGLVVSTPARDTLWAVQTPQVFEIGLYRRALQQAMERGADYTDDCQLIENAGGKVKLVECGHTNFKITTRADIALAEAVIRETGVKGGFFA